MDIIMHGLKIKFVEKPDFNNPYDYNRSISDTISIDNEINNLTRKGVVEISQ